MKGDHCVVSCHCCVCVCFFLQVDVFLIDFSPQTASNSLQGGMREAWRRRGRMMDSRPNGPIEKARDMEKGGQITDGEGGIKFWHLFPIAFFWYLFPFLPPVTRMISLWVISIE